MYETETPQAGALTSCIGDLGPDIWEGFVIGGDPQSGPVAVGGDLEPATIVGAYRRGLFPWPAHKKSIVEMLQTQYGPDVASGIIPNVTPERPATLEIPWWSPDPRGVVFVNDLRMPKNLRRLLPKLAWSTTVDECFVEVIQRCRARERVSWITRSRLQAFCRLHQLGVAHSVEVWDGDELVGGLYGLLIGGVWVGESMFWERSDASKVAFVDHIIRLQDAGGVMVDTMFPVEHLTRFGSVAIPRAEYLRILTAAVDLGVLFPRERRFPSQY